MHGQNLRNFIVGLLIIRHGGGREIGAKDYELCIYVTKGGQRISITLIFYSYYECQGTQNGTCTYNQTQYSICTPGSNQPYVCYNPNNPPAETVFEIRVALSDHKGYWTDRPMLAQIRVEENSSQISLKFDAFTAMSWGQGEEGRSCRSLS